MTGAWVDEHNADLYDKRMKSSITVAGASVIASLIVLTLAATAVILYVNLRSDEVTTRVEQRDEIRILITVDDGDELELAHVLFIATTTDQVALFDIPGNMGLIIDSLNRIDRIDTVYRADDISEYRVLVQNVLGVEIPYFISISRSGVANITDLIEGVELHIAEIFEQAGGAPTILLPAGNVVLDGPKFKLYLEYEDPNERDADRIARRQRIMQGFIAKIGARAAYLSRPEVKGYFTRHVRSNLDERSLLSLVNLFSRLDTSRMVNRRVQGATRVLESAGVEKELLFPHFEGQWLKETVRQVQETLAHSDLAGVGGQPIRIEILNGTTTVGLARRTEALFEERGFDVVNIGNASTNSVERTVVVDRRGNGALAERAAGVIRASRIEFDPADPDDLVVDVRIILGQDFDGTFVRP